MDNPFLEERDFELLGAPAYIWKYIPAGTELSFGHGQGEDPLPRAFVILTDGYVAVANGVGEDAYFPGKAGILVPGAISYISADNEVDLLICF